ncbi:MAG: AAA family ATPase [Candidatus Woesearchaeota archaeon]
MIFKDMLKDSETLFRNELALDFTYQPKILKYRDREQRHIAMCIKPLFEKRNGKNLFIYGKPGIGKTLAVQHVLREIEENYDEPLAVYVNCWQKNTSYKIAVDICEILGYKFTQNKKTEELFKIIENIVNKKSAVFVFDEIDKAEELAFLYTLLERIYRKTIILITNPKDWLLDLEERIKSRLLMDVLEFRAYNAEETRGILEQRMEIAFVPGVFDRQSFETIVKKAVELQDIRSGLHIMRESAMIAESQSSKKISIEHVELAIKKLDTMTVKSSEDLEDDTRFMLEVIKDNTNKKIGELFRIYQERGGVSSYKTFQRKVKKLEDNGFIAVKKINGGAEGSTSIISYEKTPKLTDF